MIAFLHQAPCWLAGAIIIGVMIGGSICGIHVLSRYEPPEKRHDYNDIVGFVIAAVGVVQAVILAWVAVMAWENYDNAASEVEREASYVGDIARIASGLPEPVATRIHDQARLYAETVVSLEWPEMSSGTRPDAALATLHELQNSIVTFRPASKGEDNLHADLLAKLTALLDARRSRVFRTVHGIAAVVWGVVILGAGCLVSVSFFFGLEKQRHRILTSSLAFSTGLVLLMIEAMDLPFLGRYGIAPDPIVYVLDAMKQGDGGS